MSKLNNQNLNNAKKAKDDEFYTLIDDIHAELDQYRDKFRGKTILCNCDDPSRSNFVKSLLINFNRYGLKELIAIGYKTDILRVKSTKEYLIGTQTDLDPRGIKRLFLQGGTGVLKPSHGNTDAEGSYYEPGDFRSAESLDLLNQCYIVITNPPFSLFREFFSILIKSGKQFLIIGSSTAYICKDIFPLVKNNQVWLGVNRPRNFERPDGSIEEVNSRWWTNIDNPRRHKKTELDEGCIYKGHEEKYPKFDNYDAIAVSKCAEIPVDYDGVMGLPTTFLDLYNPEQFEIVGINTGAIGPDFISGNDGRRRLYLNGKMVFIRLIVKLKK